MKRRLVLFVIDFVCGFQLRLIRGLPAFVGILIASHCPGVADEPTSPAHRLIVGWDDAVIVCGPGTVAGMDSPEAIEKMVKRWKGRGHQGIYWRVDEAMLPDRFMTRWNTKVSPGVNYLLERVDQELHAFPVLKTLLAAAEREQLEVWAWYPTIYSNGAPPTGPGFTQSWLYENKFATDHPEILSVDRAGNKHFMIWEYAYPEARKAKVSEFVQFARDYGFKRFVACLRTEAAQMQPAPKHADQFGFNTPVVEEMKKRYGVDILTDSRFDYSDPQFDVRDPLVEAWRKLRGEYLTEFYRELRAALNEVDPEIQIAVQIPGDRAGTCLGNWHLDWRTWVDEGLVNELVVPVVLDGYEGYPSSAAAEAAGYIDGAITVETVRDFVKQSRQPTARVIQAGGPASNYHIPPPNADGWRLDAWHDLWFYNMAERWEQWQRDIDEFGHIRFIEQSFDEFPIDDDGYGGGFGDFCHRPDLRLGPGYWERLGDGTDELPHAQSRVRRGVAGNAIKLTRAENGLANLTVRHHGRHDRSLFPFPGDTAISSGHCQFDFWLFRPDDKSGGVITLQYDNDPVYRHNVALYIAAGDPAVVHFTQDGKYVASTATLAVNKWQRVTLKVDLERKTYSAETLAEDAPTDAVAEVICQDVPYAAQFNAFNMIEFSPQGETGSIFYLDDVSLRWTPTPNFERPGTEMLLQASFEPKENDRWTMREGQPTDIIIDNDVSFGHELHSLRMRGSGGRVQLSTPSLTWQPDGLMLVDSDIFLRSDLPYVQITPGPNVTSSDDVGIALVTTNDHKPLIELRTHQSTWHYLDDNTLIDTNLSAAFDAWNHLQLVINPENKSYCVFLQVVGESPRVLCRGSLDRMPAAGDTLGVEFFCSRSKSQTDGPTFDNLRATRRTLKEVP